MALFHRYFVSVTAGAVSVVQKSHMTKLANYAKAAHIKSRFFIIIFWSYDCSALIHCMGPRLCQSELEGADRLAHAAPQAILENKTLFFHSFMHYFYLLNTS